MFGFFKRKKVDKTTTTFPRSKTNKFAEIERILNHYAVTNRDRVRQPDSYSYHCSLDDNPRFVKEEWPNHTREFHFRKLLDFFDVMEEAGFIEGYNDELKPLYEYVSGHVLIHDSKGKRKFHYVHVSYQEIYPMIEELKKVLED